MNILDALDAQSQRTDLPDFRAGDTVKVHARVVEGNRSRVQIFQGVVIRRQGDGLRETFTVRKVSFGVGVERTYPINSPAIDRIEVVTRGDVRRAKLYYLRELRGKKAKIKEKREKQPRADFPLATPPDLRGCRIDQIALPWSYGRSEGGDAACVGGDSASTTARGASDEAPGRWCRFCGPESGMVQMLDEDGTVDPWRRRARRTRRQMPLWQELPLLLVVAFCLAVLIRTFLLQAFFIPSGSMEDTLLVGDRVLVNKVVYDVRDPARGEVVVFRGTDNWAPQDDAGAAEPGFAGKLGRTLGDLVGVSRPGEKDFIKRVIGVPGDRVSCCDDRAGSRSTACRWTSRTCSGTRRWTCRRTRGSAGPGASTRWSCRPGRSS